MRNRYPSYIVTGPKQVDKSTLCWEFMKYLQSKGVSMGGVITLQNKSKSFFLVNTQRKISFEAQRKEEFIPIGKFKVHKKHMDIVKAQILEDIDCEYLFLDEIGILEIMGKGYFNILEKVLARTDGTILVIRELILDDFFNEFPPRFEYEILNVTRRDFENILK
ncbi:MAG: nucleoside-triphosphatase, partial [Candidatus Hodarchaeales archaeon]